jgi:hypothetical protein
VTTNNVLPTSAGRTSDRLPLTPNPPPRRGEGGAEKHELRPSHPRITQEGGAESHQHGSRPSNRNNAWVRLATLFSPFFKDRNPRRLLPPPGAGEGGVRGIFRVPVSYKCFATLAGIKP